MAESFLTSIKRGISSPLVEFKELVQIMVDADIQRERILMEGTKAHGVTWMNHI